MPQIFRDVNSYLSSYKICGLFTIIGDAKIIKYLCERNKVIIIYYYYI
jgi:hypothetical protein